MPQGQLYLGCPCCRTFAPYWFREGQTPDAIVRRLPTILPCGLCLPYTALPAQFGTVCFPQPSELLAPTLYQVVDLIAMLSLPFPGFPVPLSPSHPSPLPQGLWRHLEWEADSPSIPLLAPLLRLGSATRTNPVISLFSLEW